MRHTPPRRLGPSPRRGLWVCGRVLFTGILVVAFSRPMQAQQTAVAHQHTPLDGEVSLFQTREASGTAWVPDTTPMDGLHRRVGSWQLMVHGAVFSQWLYESGNRHRTGGFQSTQFSSVNWGMVMARRRVGAATIGLRAMISAEPWTVGNCGFINLLASGEMCEGDTIHDRQHPHDTFMELAAEYDRPVRGRVRWQVYGGLSGEPALGPAGFPHRPSAAPNPIAPVTHHWLDSTHITFGLLTAGLYNDRWKIEGSVFNSREPDARRTNIELGRLDSASARLSWAPSSRITAQISAGHLHQAEAEFAPFPRSDVNRATASLMYQTGSDTVRWATTVAYGINGGTEVIPDDAVFLVTHGGLLESTLTIRQRHI